MLLNAPSFTGKKKIPHSEQYKQLSNVTLCWWTRWGKPPSLEQAPRTVSGPTDSFNNNLAFRSDFSSKQHSLSSGPKPKSSLLLLFPAAPLHPPPFIFFKGSAWIFPLELLRLSPAPLLLCTPAQKQILLFTPASPPGSRTRRELGKVLFRSVNSGVRVRVDIFDLHTPCDQWLWARAETASGDKTQVKWRGLFRAAEARQTKQTQTVLDKLCSTQDR